MGELAARPRQWPAAGRTRGAPERRYAVPQRHAEYAPAAHETWRRLLARSEALVSRHEARLHPSYVDGFRRLVLPWTSIPRLEDVNAALAPYGWSTLCVTGYIPPEVYSGLIARGIFPIAREIRPREHLEFSPTPDLAHDLLGHIPMLVSAEYCQFLRRISRATASTLPTRLDHELFRAQRALGALCNGADRHPRSLLEAQARVEAAHAALARAPSPLAQLDRLYLWSIEFGLLGTPDDYRAYGAGLLSSPAEAEALFTQGATVVELSAAATRRGINFSDHQSAYFVARDYRQLNAMLSRVESSRAG